MNSINEIRTSVREKMIAMYVATITTLRALFMEPAMARVSTRAKGLSFLEYAILAAAIVGVGVLIANFFGERLKILLDDITTGFDQRK